jgi:hypothetical protein
MRRTLELLCGSPTNDFTPSAHDQELGRRAQLAVQRFLWNEGDWRPRGRRRKANIDPAVRTRILTEKNDLDALLETDIDLDQVVRQFRADLPSGPRAALVVVVAWAIVAAQLKG